MTTWLVVRLAAPMASFGERAGNARRGSAARPTKSALLGLLGAALGIDRDDAEGQRALATGYRIATRTVRPGTIVQDFHTFQSLPAAAGSVATRADALARRDRLVTSITVREYRADVVFDAAFRALDGARWPLDRLAEALCRPVYTPCLGRRSCPLGWPLDPRLVEAEDVVAAFEDGDHARPSELALVRHGRVEVAVEDPTDIGARVGALRRSRRLDQPDERAPRSFRQRDEYLLTYRRTTS